MILVLVTSASVLCNENHSSVHFLHPASCFLLLCYVLYRGEGGGGNMGTEQRSLVHSAFVLDKRTGILSCKTANVAS